MANGLLARTPQAPAPRDFFERFFDGAFGGTLFPVVRNSLSPAQGWLPCVDVKETENALEFLAEVPGLKKDEVALTIEDNVLTIAGERRFERDEKKEDYHRIERSYGRFTRSFALPANVDGAKAEAKFEDGLLKVRVPKSDAARPRKVEIR